MPRLVLPSRAVLLAASLALAAPAGGWLRAQQPPPPPPSAPPAAPTAADSFAVLIGVVFDSIHGTPLAGATVRLDGKASRAARTGANGQFMLDSVAPGEYVLELLHPLLDTLGVSLRTPQVVIAAGQQATLDLLVNRKLSL